MDTDISPQPVTRRQTMLRILKRTILIISVIATSLSACMDASKIDLDTSGATGLLLGGLTFEVLAGGGSAGCQPFGSSMIGCKGSISFASRASLCPAGMHVCSAAEYLARRGSTVPDAHFWVDDDLGYAGADGACAVSLAGGGYTQCNAGAGPMRVCSPNATFLPSCPWGSSCYQDAFGNQCNWRSCGYENNAANDYFGGCESNLTAGTLCCL